MMVRCFLRICHLIAALTFGTTALAEAPAEVRRADARSQVTAFMNNYARDLVKRLGAGTRVEYDSGAIASGTDTKSCTAPLSINPHNQQSLARVTLLVACGNEWSIYIPVDLTVYQPVVVATRPLGSGAVIAADDVELNALDVGRLSGTYLTTLDEAVGMGVKRPLSPGRAVLMQHLEQPLLIRRGEGVIISAERGDLAVKMSGTAMTDGRRGELIRIKSQSNTRIVNARVVGPGHVMVAM